jgi:hypothetical protein
VIGSVITIRSGNAEPYVSPGELPFDGPVGMFGVAAGLVIAGVLVVNRLQKRSWVRAGRRTNLAPTDGTLVGKPDLEGTVDGRTVRAKTVKRKTGDSGGEQGSSYNTFTVVETDLARPADTGLVLGPAGGSAFDSGAVTVDLSAQMATVGDVAFVGDEDLAREVVTTRVSDALGAAGGVDPVFAGDTDDIVTAAIPEPDGLVAGALADKMQETVENRFPGSPETVSIERPGVVLDPTELEENASAVAAVGDSFDRTTTPDPGTRQSRDSEST